MGEAKRKQQTLMEQALRASERPTVSIARLKQAVMVTPKDVDDDTKAFMADLDAVLSWIGVLEKSGETPPKLDA